MNHSYLHNSNSYFKWKSKVLNKKKRRREKELEQEKCL